VAFNLIITVRAGTDAVEASSYYAAIQPELCTRFLSELLAAYSKLKDNPQHYSFISAKRKNNLRDIKINHFPYTVIYEISGSNVIIYAIHNSHRKLKRVK